MTVTYTDEHQGFLGHAQVNPDFLVGLKQCGGKLTLIKNSFKVLGSKYALSGSLPASMASMMHMSPTHSMVLESRSVLEVAIHKFTKQVDPHGLKVNLPAPYGSVAASAVALAAKSAPKVAPPASSLVMPEKLANAGKLYQPVHGTSSGSVYSVVALSNSMKVAVRVGSEKVSVRVEGACVTDPAVAKKLVELGFADNKGSHFSMHLSCGDVPIDRVIGAVLASLGGEFVTPMPIFNKVKEQCK